ncbi:hypothetical protein M9Y10_004650 [Tritrichomonas musculus]|uniref:Uncharacterized protein n=1 Tax=Tritrichomonas musculus TaxID=1915356 RepID=A0ABR2JJM7_9EUKA
MAKNLRGSKRLQVIQNWLNGKDDDEWEVFPCKTEGKYIVRPRKESNNHVEPILKKDEETTANTPENIYDEKMQSAEVHNEPEHDEQLITETKHVIKNKIKRPPSMTHHNNYEYDPTINLEILNQLKLLGEEIKSSREKKEQKRMIKDVVQKQISRPRMRYNYEFIEPEYRQYPNIQSNEQPIEQPVEHTQQLYSMRKNRIFADVI